MAREKITDKKPKQKQARDRGSPTLAFTIIEFCDAHRISKARYYELKKQGLTPIEMIIGHKRLISAESASAWRKAREDAVNAA